MSFKIGEVTKEKFSKFGDFINPYSVESTNINMNTTKSYFDLANIEIDGEDKRVRLNLFEAKKTSTIEVFLKIIEINLLFYLYLLYSSAIFPRYLSKSLSE